MDEPETMQKFERFQKLLGKISDTDEREGLVLLPLQEIIEGRAKAFEDHAIMTRKAKGIVHDCTVRDPSSSSPVDVFDNVGFNESGFIITLDIPDDFDRHDAIVTFSAPESCTFLQVKAFYDPSKSSHTDFSQNPIPVGNSRAFSTFEVTSRVIMAG